jgi:hypothetical protein
MFGEKMCTWRYADIPTPFTSIEKISYTRTGVVKALSKATTTDSTHCGQPAFFNLSLLSATTYLLGLLRRLMLVDKNTLKHSIIV